MKILYCPDYHHDLGIQFYDMKKPRNYYTYTVLKGLQLVSPKLSILIKPNFRTNNLFYSIVKNVSYSIKILRKQKHFDLILGWYPNLITLLTISKILKININKKVIFFAISPPQNTDKYVTKKILYYFIRNLLKNSFSSLVLSNDQIKQMNLGFGIDKNKIHTYKLGFDHEFWLRTDLRYKKDIIFFSGSQSRDWKLLGELIKSTTFNFIIVLKTISIEQACFKLKIKKHSVYQNRIKFYGKITYQKLLKLARFSLFHFIVMDKNTDQPAGITSLLECISVGSIPIISKGPAFNTYLRKYYDWGIDDSLNIRERINQIVQFIKLMKMNPEKFTQNFDKLYCSLLFDNVSKEFSILFSNIVENYKNLRK